MSMNAIRKWYFINTCLRFLPITIWWDNGPAPPLSLPDTHLQILLFTNTSPLYPGDCLSTCWWLKGTCDEDLPFNSFLSDWQIIKVCHFFGMRLLSKSRVNLRLSGWLTLMLLASSINLFVYPFFHSHIHTANQLSTVHPSTYSLSDRSIDGLIGWLILTYAVIIYNN